MARYFFHTENGDRHSDEDGTELPDLAAVKRAAVLTLCEMLKVRAGDFWDAGSFRLIVTDEAGLILYVLDVNGVEAPAVRPASGRV